MNGREVAEILGIPYHQLDYLIRSGVYTPAGQGRRGVDREFTDRDLEILRLAVELRKAGWRPNEIKKILDALDDWNPDQLTYEIIIASKRGGYLIFWTDSHWVHGKGSEGVVVRVNTLDYIFKTVTL